jgi:FkbM family methyltransferase
MPWVSYAQNYEDVVLTRVLADVEKGSYIDVGAQDPRLDSVTLAFYERGWRGINIEPVPHWHALLAQARPGDANLCLAAGDREGRIRFFEIVGSGLSTSDPEFAQRHRAAGLEVIEYEVPVRRLDAVCAEQGVHTAHFLKIDVEGAEREVLRGIRLDVLRPWIVLMEATEPNSRVSRHAEWEARLLERGYSFAYGDGLNRYYLADEHAGLAERFGPPTVLDDFVRREQVDLAAEIESRLADVDALSHRRAGEIDTLVARILDKDIELADWQGRWQAGGEESGRLRGELGHAADREAGLRAELHRERSESGELRTELGRVHQAAEDLRTELDRVHHAAEDLRTELGRVHHAADDQRAELDRVHRAAEDLRAEVDRVHREAAVLQALLADASERVLRQDADFAAQAQRLHQADRDLARLSRRVPDLQAEVHAATQAHAVAHEELLRHVVLIDGLRDEQARLLASRSWRLTAPLRAVNARLADISAYVRRILGPRPATVPGTMPEPPPVPLSEDAERILAMAPVRGAHDDRDAD